jgi:hypothetical protein
MTGGDRRARRRRTRLRLRRWRRSWRSGSTGATSGAGGCTTSAGCCASCCVVAMAWLVVRCVSVRARLPAAGHWQSFYWLFAGQRSQGGQLVAEGMRPEGPLTMSGLRTAGCRGDGPYGWLLASRALCSLLFSWCYDGPGSCYLLRRHRCRGASGGRRPQRLPHSGITPAQEPAAAPWTRRVGRCPWSLSCLGLRWPRSERCSVDDEASHVAGACTA